MKIGTRVRMNERCKLKLCDNDSSEHVDEFGQCEGVVIGPAEGMGSGIVDVRWEPSGLRYCYWADDLAVIQE